MSEILAGALMGLGDGLVDMAREKKEQAAERRNIELKRHEYDALASDPDATRSQRATARARSTALDKMFGDESDAAATAPRGGAGLPRRTAAAKGEGKSDGKTSSRTTSTTPRPAGLGTRPVSREDGMQTEAKAEIERLASMSPEAYEAQRQRVASRLGWRLSALDDRVMAARDSRASKLDTVPDTPKPGVPSAPNSSATPSASAPVMPQDRVGPAGPNQKPAQETSVLDEARAAIRQGAPRDAVIARLRELGVDPKGLQ